jgi:hypothetical protein
VSFTHHKLIAAANGEDEARSRFERMITECVRLQHPTVRNLRPAPGDWGIDAMVGELDGQVSIWQAKFFINGIGSTQRQQITKTFEQAIKKSQENGYSVEVWTLCIPIQISPEEARWWDKWRRKVQKGHADLTIQH